MLVDLIFDGITELEEYKEIKSLADDNKAQAKIESKFLKSCEEFGEILNLIGKAKEKTDFIPSKEIVSNCKEIIKAMEENYKSRRSNEDTNQHVIKIKKCIEEDIKSEWSNFYSDKSGQLLNMLNAVIEITPDRVYTKQIMNRIQKASFWTDKIENYEFFTSGIKDGKEVIAKLDLDDAIVEFLKRVESGNITIADLTPNIMLWINKENLADKFKIGFLN